MVMVRVKFDFSREPSIALYTWSRLELPRQTRRELHRRSRSSAFGGDRQNTFMSCCGDYSSTAPEYETKYRPHYLHFARPLIGGSSALLTEWRVAGPTNWAVSDPLFDPEFAALTVLSEPPSHTSRLPLRLGNRDFDK